MNQVFEYAGNMHMHTPYSDGEKYHAEIASAAADAGLDFIIVTDHNIRVTGVEGYYRFSPQKQVLLLTGEEVHDMRRQPQRNHMLIYGVDRELAPFSQNPQDLIDQTREVGGCCFLAHPVDPAAPLFNESNLDWETWDIEGYTGIELWNYMSEFKNYLGSKFKAVQAALNPDKFVTGPLPETLALWDKLLSEGKPIKIIGGSDAHGTAYSMGPITRTIFPYEFLFRCVNTHIVVPKAFNGELDHDRDLIIKALQEGHAFVGYDLPHSTRGFRFSAQGRDNRVVMGGQIRIGHGVTLQTVIPSAGEVRLIKDGEVVFQETEGTHHTYIARQTGSYRVEVYIDYKGKKRGWIFSNPILVTS